MTKSAIGKNKAVIATAVGTVSVEPLERLEHYWKESSLPLKWDCLFMLPPWLGEWWSYFGQDPDVRLLVVRDRDTVLGVAPITVSGDTAYLVSDSDLIDYSDLTVMPARKRSFFSILMDHLRREGISRFDAGRVRADSTVVACLHSDSGSFNCDASCDPVDALYEMDLPKTWDGYFDMLSGRERHEIRRKLRRLESVGRVRLSLVQDEDEVSGAMDTFVALFRSNLTEKKKFMTGRMEAFFRAMAAGMARAGLLKLFILRVDDTPAAAVMCFDYGSTVYLYNNGYDQRFSHLSVGLLSKVFTIRESILRGRRRYNFLRGQETYKGRLGGRPVGLLHCKVVLR